MQGAGSQPCPEDDVLAAHVAGELEPDSVERMAVHLDGCDTCRSVIATLLKGASPAEAPPPTIAVSKAARKRMPGVSIGGNVDRYRVIRLVGSGGMGMVYAAHDTELDRAVALKVMRPELGRTTSFTDRMVRESRLMARLSHPSVITVYDVGRHDDQVFVAMELIEGATLGSWLRDQRRSWREVVAVFRRAGEGLGAAHRAGLVHRDFKPENVLLAIDGDSIARVVVTDFGVARAVAGDDDTDSSGGTPASLDTPVQIDLTATGVAVGTPAYMAPEQLDARRVDARADVFGFAVALWEALWGERPFAGRSVGEIRQAIDRGVARAQRPGVRGVDDSPPRWVERTLRHALAADPARRTRSMEELLRRLDPARHDRRRRIGIALGVGGLVAVGAAAVAIGLSRRDRGAEYVTPEDATVCDGIDVDQVWTDEQRRAVRTLVATTGNPVADRIADRAIAATDGHARRWRKVRDVVCARPEDDPMAGVEAECLAIRLDELDAMLQFLPELSRIDLIQLDLTMTSLPSVEICATPAAAGVVGEIDAPEELQAQAAEVRMQFFTIDAIRLAGDERRAVAELEALGPIVEELGVPAITAEYLYNLGVSISSFDAARSIELLRRAAAEAEKARHDEIAARAWTELASAYVEELDLERAEDSLLHADAMISRAGDSPVQRIDWLDAQAWLRYHQDRYEEAVTLFKQAIAIAREVAPDTLVHLQQGLAAALADQGKLDEALALDRAAVAEREAQFGADHVLVAEARNQVASDLLYRGDVDAALVELEAAAAIADRAYGPDNQWSGLYLHNIAEAQRNAGRYEASLATHARARRVLIASGSGDGTLVALSLENEAGALIGLGRWTEAEARLREALARYQDALGDDAFDTATCRINLGEALRGQGKLDEALIEQRAGLEALRAIHEQDEDHPYLAYARAEIGKTLLAGRRIEEAVAELEAAVRTYADSELDPAMAADAEFALARALADDREQRIRADQLAAGALEVFHEAGGEWTDEAEQARAWLAARRRPGR